MKKFLAVLALICLSSTAVFAMTSTDNEFIVKAGIQPQGSVSIDGNSSDTNVGISAGFEYFKYLNNIVAVGAGASYDLPRKFKDNAIDGSVSFLPLSIAVKARTPLQGFDNNFPFIVGRLGYSAFMNNSDYIKSSSGGLYYSLGLGVSIDYLVIEAAYAANKFSFKNPADKDGTYSTISLYVGFKFE
ncbi:MAG: porin family protein [Endomicrobia bacterium]|nr:porin family protein [Endomicrobiia bacterium]MCL2799438.1 porin family protein [Endomicrobiia bacterium]